MAERNLEIQTEANYENDDTHEEDQETHEENRESTSQEDEATNSNELKRSTKKALMEFRCRLEDAIQGNYLLGKSHPKRNEKARENLKEISLWGVPLLPSKGHQGTDIILLKFLKAKENRVPEAFTMLRKTLRWRRENKIEGILEEKLCSHLENVVYINSRDKEGHPLLYTMYADFKDKKLYKKTFGTEEKCDEFLRLRVQFMEKGIKELSFKPDEVDSIIQITDLKSMPGSGLKELRLASKKVMLMIQDNYPELIHRYIVINVPFWYYTFSHLLNQKAKKKFIFARPSRVTQTLLKFIAPENLPVDYGGLKREQDSDFSPEDKVSELRVKGGTTRSIKIPVAEAGVTMVWDLTTVGWEVTYKEEFIPDDECSYKVLLQKEKKMEVCVRNSFYISEPGKIVITIDNESFKKKRVLYRFKAKPTVPMYVFFK